MKYPVEMDFFLEERDGGRRPSFLTRNTRSCHRLRRSRAGNLGRFALDEGLGVRHRVDPLKQALDDFLLTRQRLALRLPRSGHANNPFSIVLCSFSFSNFVRFRFSMFSLISVLISFYFDFDFETEIGFFFSIFDSFRCVRFCFVFGTFRHMLGGKKGKKVARAHKHARVGGAWGQAKVRSG